MKTFFKVLLYILGFPLMIAAITYVSWPILQAGKTYSLSVAGLAIPATIGGIAVAAVIGLIYLIVGLITWGASRRAKTLAGIRKATAALVIAAVVLTTGVWFAIDKLMPDILDDATSGTILYNDVRDDYLARAEYHELLLEKFIEMNVANKNLTAMTLEEYKEEGYRNEEVKTLLHENFKSFDQDGYATFVGPWLDLANDGRMTIPTIVHLIINDRQESTENPDKENIIFIYKGEGREQAGLTASPIRWTILDMQEGALSFNIDALSMLSGITDVALKDMLTGILTAEATTNMIEGFIEPILAALNDAIADEALAGAVIKIGVNIVSDSDIAADKSLEKGNINISITPANNSRGMWDYMHMAWLNSNDLLFLVISLFPARRIMLFFGGLVVIFSLLIGAIRESQYKKKLALPAETANQIALNGHKPSNTQEYFSPYMKAYHQSVNNYDTRGSLNLPKSIDPNSFGR